MSRELGGGPSWETSDFWRVYDILTISEDVTKLFLADGGCR
jgi:hypothetical protein